MKKLLLSIFCIGAFASFAQTEIEPFAPTVPGTYIGDFEGYTIPSVIPDVSPDWTEEGDVAGNDFIADDGATTAYFVGTGDHCFASVENGESITLISPEMDFGGATGSPTLTFRYRMDDGGGAPSFPCAGCYGDSEVEVLDKESSGGAWNVLATFSVVDNAWHDETVDLSGAGSYSTYYLGFVIRTVSAGSIITAGLAAFDEIVVTAEACTPSSSSFAETACASYTVPSGDETYTTSGVVMDTIPNAAGCDSVMTIDVTIDNPDVSVTTSGSTLTAGATGVSYQWIDCSDNSPIAGATSQDFTPTADGDYAVIIDDGGCVDTSDCNTITGVGLSDDMLMLFNIYPNPTDGIVSIRIGDVEEYDVLEIWSAEGRLIETIEINEENLLEVDLTNLANGIYNFRFSGTEGTKVKRILKK